MIFKIILLIIVVLILTAIFIMYMSYKYWSDINFPGGPIFFVKGKENKGMYVMYSGKFSKVILPSKKMHVESGPDYKFESGAVPQKTFLGMYWIGLWPFYKIHFRHQQWMEWESTKDGRRIRFRDEMTPYLFVKPFEYAMFLEEGEDENGVPLNVWFTVILQPEDAYKPVFGNDDAYGQIQTLCLGEALLFVRKKNFANLGKGQVSNTDNDLFSAEIQGLNVQIPGRPKGDNVVKILGYRILDAKINSIAVGGELKKELLEATVLNYTAGEKAKAMETEAEGVKNSEIKKAEGRKLARILEAEGEAEGKKLLAEAEKIAGMLNVDVEKYSYEARVAFYNMLKGKDLRFAQKIELAKKIFSDSKLTSYVGGKGVLPTFNINNKEGQ